MKKIFFLVVFCLMLLNCKSQEINSVRITVKRGDNAVNNYYFKNEKIMAITSSQNDSISFKYKDTLLMKIEQYKLDKLVGEANFVYTSDLLRDYTFSENYEDYYENYYEKVYTEIPYNNRYKMLDKDFYYIDAVLNEVKNWKNYNTDKKLKSASNLRFKLDVGVSNTRFSPFVYGTTIKEMKLHVVDNFLKEMDADFIDKPSGKRIKYKKYYQYDNQGRLSFTKTLNMSSGKIENHEKFEYREWLVYP